ncbi:MAG: MBL fold metallo-hydrolase [Clostridiales bacterium]|nr:MBL fold metallo-hydrolase [Clostridiales bacterium]
MERTEYRRKYIPITPFEDPSVTADFRKKYKSAVYAVDPYVEVFQLRDNMWALLAPCTHAVSDNWIYLIEGPEKALFIDNGYGIGNLKGLGEMLTGKPCITAPTHFHGDHAGGSAQFDEIYCHEYCADMMKTRMTRADWDSFNHVGEAQHRPYYLEEDVIDQKCEPIACPNHFVINLGGDYDIELIHTGGHAPGLSCYLDKKARILYTGDAVFESREETPGLGTGLNGAKSTKYNILHPEAMDYRFYMKQIIGLADRVEEFDFCMPGHGFTDSPARIVTDTRDAICAAVENPRNYDEEVVNHQGKIQYNMRRGLARVRYSLELFSEEE